MHTHNTSHRRTLPLRDVTCDRKARAPAREYVTGDMHVLLTQRYRQFIQSFGLPHTAQNTRSQITHSHKHQHKPILLSRLFPIKRQPRGPRARTKPHTTTHSQATQIQSDPRHTDRLS